MFSFKSARAGLLILILLFVPAILHAEGFSAVKVIPSSENDALEQKAISVFLRNVLSKTDSKDGGRTLTIYLERDPSLAGEAFSIAGKGRKYTISASDSRGLLYGLGRMLHQSSFDDGKFFPGQVCGAARPEKAVRGIYFATHFGNYYESAPIEELGRYVEDLALWGYNSIQVWFDMHQYTGIDDPQAVSMTGRLAAILKAGRSVGMNSGILMLANEGYCNTPEQLRAKRVDFTGFYGCEICPSVPGGTELILSNRREMMDVFAGLGVPFDTIWIWPYDQGGCTCGSCSPWGGNGFVKLSKLLSQEIRAKFPSARVVLSTWCFDEGMDKGEWKGLAEAFRMEKPWADYIMADSHKEFPAYLLSNPVPGDLPLINFPEISMFGHNPWGGYGANPMPVHYSSIYKGAAELLQGGFPYSEGLYEDFNKALYAQMYWDSSLSPKEMTLRYAASEFSGRYAGQIADAIFILEKNHGSRVRFISTRDHTPQIVKLPENDFGAEKAFAILDRINGLLPRNIRESQKWQLLYLRAKVDFELRKSGGRFTVGTNDIFLQLVKLSHLENAFYRVYPPYIAPYSGAALSDFSKQFDVKEK